MKRVMCVHLPGWPLQRLGHEQPELRQRAVAIVEPAARGPRVLLASRRAVRAGVYPGMPLAEATALVPASLQLAVHDYDADADRRALLALAKAAERYSPVVALEEGPAPEGLLIDVAGCGSCFGGEDKLFAQATRQYAADGWSARIAIADTVGAAWAQARFAPSLVPPGATRDRLVPLPLAALRLPADMRNLLGQLGLHRVGDLLTLPRADLAARFGPLLMRRLDQALGQAPEVVVLPAADPDLQAAETFDFPIERFDEMCQVIDRLLEDVHRALDRRDLGARQLVCRLYHDDAPPTVLEVGLYRPTRCPRHLGELLRTRLEQTQLAGPVAAVDVNVPVAERIGEVQHALFERDNDETGLGALIDRLNNLLGHGAVSRPCCVADAQPECAVRFRPVADAACVGAGKMPTHAASVTVPRPLTIWPAPVPVDVLAVYPDGPPLRFVWQGTRWDVASWWGPERIETGWWRGDDVRRDYYVVTTPAGSRFWLFRRRDDGRWFLHGCFD